MSATTTLRNALDALTSNADAGASVGLYADGDAPTNFSATVNELERRKRISESVKAVNDALAPSGASILLQAFIHAHIGLSEGRKEYRVPDIRLGEAMHKGTAADDETDAEIIERSNTSLRKLAQRGRTHAQRFYEQTGIRLLEVIEHGHQEGAKNIATLYRLHVWTLIEKVAQARPRERRKLAFKLLEEMREKQPEAVALFEPSPQQLEQREERELNRIRATVLTHSAKLADSIQAHGGDPVAFIGKLATEMVVAAKRTLEECRKSEGRPIPKMAQVEATATNENAVNKNHFVGKKPNSVFALSAPALTLSAPVLSTLKDKIVDTPRQMETHPPDSSSAAAAATPDAKAEPRAPKAIGGRVSTSSVVGGLDHALKTVDCFARVGVDSFDVNFLRELKDESRLADTWKTYSAIGLRDALPKLLKRSEARKQSLVVRITDKRLLFVDDLNLETVKLLYGHVVVAYCTSPDSYHAWLAFDTSDARDEAAARLLPMLRKTSAANKGSGGKFRLPGSRNFKLKHEPRGFPLIIPTNTPARRTSLAALDAADLLAPVPIVEKPSSDSRAASARPRAFPSYERCKADCKTRHEDGSPDLSVADKDWCILALGRGWMRADVEAKFRTLREKARRPDYVRSTLDYAERVVSTRRTN
jgi:hypothetical protein